MTTQEPTPLGEISVEESQGEEIVETKARPEERLKELEKEVEELKKALREEQEKSRGYFNQLLYLEADFENYRKRMEKEFQHALEAGGERLILQLLSVVDELELAVKAGEGGGDGEALVEGVKMVLKKFWDVLKGEGLSVIEAVGKTFDPNLHEAVEKIEDEGVENGLVLEEVRRGFTFKGRVIRPALVKVAMVAGKKEG